MTRRLFSLCLLVLLAACGQTGALYLPDQAPPKSRVEQIKEKMKEKSGQPQDQQSPQDPNKAPQSKE